MHIVFEAFVGVTLVAAIASLVIAVLALRRREVPGTVAFCVMMLAAAWWCAAYAAELLAASETAKDLWGRSQYLGIVLVGPCWLLFALRYTGKLQRPSWTQGLLFVLPAMTLAAALGGAGLGLVWTGIGLQSRAGVTTLVIAHGPLFWADLAYTYGCLLIGAVVLIATVLSEARPLTRQGVLLVVAAVLPGIANAVSLAMAGPMAGLDLTPASFVLSGALLAVCLSRYAALQIFPGAVQVARDVVFRGMRDGVLVLSREGVVLSANPAAERLLGVPPGGATGCDIAQTLPGLPDPLPTLAATDAQPEATFEAVLGEGDGARHLEVVISPLAAGGSAPGLVLSMRDETERHLLLEELKHQALHDELTGLPNRSLLRAQLAQLLALERRRHGQVALLMLDLDRFKEINDTFGHAAGDRVLQTTAVRLRDTVRESDVVARLGGDEFAVVLPGSSGRDAAQLAASLREVLAAPVSLSSRKLRTGASIGVAVAPLDGDDEILLMQHADVALYRAKDDSRGVARYEAAMDPNSPETLELLDDVRAAIERDEVVMYYQPIVACGDGAVVRMEALARWTRDDGTVVSGGEFVPLIKRCGLLEHLTTFAVRGALAACRTWEAAGWRTSVAVNLSAEDLRDVEIVQRVQAALDEYRLQPERLWLEITETSVMSDPDKARTVLDSLCDTGVRVCIDDFGVGQSSLAYVRTLPAVDLKIDRSFTSEIGTHDDCLAIIRATVALGHDLGLTVTGEGVEDDEALRTLRALGCDAVQGFGIARPMTAEAALAWARSRAIVAA